MKAARLSLVFLIYTIGIVGVAHTAETHAQAARSRRTPRSAYGYYPYEKGYGPIYANRELDRLTFSPRKHGLDYGYGIGYFFGFGPREHRGDHSLKRNPWAP